MTKNTFTHFGINLLKKKMLFLKNFLLSIDTEPSPKEVFLDDLPHSVLLLSPIIYLLFLHVHMLTPNVMVYCLQPIIEMVNFRY